MAHGRARRRGLRAANLIDDRERAAGVYAREMRWTPLVVLVSLVACQKGWTERELKPTDVKLGSGTVVKISLPDGVKRSNGDDAVVAMLEPTPLDGPSVILTRAGSTPLYDSADAYIKDSHDGQLEKRDVAGGWGVGYERGGPHVHVTKKIGSVYVECDAAFDGGPKDLKARTEMIWKICSSIN